ncbi:MAG TPA: cell division protein FtsL [Nevskiaceae bacterium]|nr:cell division protein FtsL [Nevskiaceae bacterium]
MTLCGPSVSYSRGLAMIPMLLAVACVASGVVVVEVEHHSRDVTAALAHQRHLHDELHVQYGQLRLEQATLGRHARVERLAQSQFDMIEPQQYVIVVPHGSAAGARP